MLLYVIITNDCSSPYLKQNTNNWFIAVERPDRYWEMGLLANRYQYR